MKLARKDAREIAKRFCARRLLDLLEEALAEEAAAVLADGRATLRIAQEGDAPDGVELTPTRASAASLLAMVEYEALVNCFIAGHYTHEAFSREPTELLEEVRVLARALIAGTYVEEERDRGHRATVKAHWPGGGSTVFTFGSGVAKEGWRRRAYDPY